MSEWPYMSVGGLSYFQLFVSLNFCYGITKWRVVRVVSVLVRLVI